MHLLRPIVSVVTALAFFVQVSGLAYAQDVQPVPYAPSQPVPLPPSQPSAPTAPPTAAPPTAAPQTGGWGTAPAPGLAPAPGFLPGRPPGDTIYLKDGGLMRGTLIEMLPNDHATIQLPTGQSAIIEWGRIDHIERGSLQPAPGGLAAPPHPRGPRRGPMMAAGPAVIVHIDADAPVILESISPGTGRWTMVCDSPCDRPLPANREYRIVGDGIRPSRAFPLEAPPGQRVTISVSTASRGAFAGGVAMSSVGVAAIAIGLVVLVIGAVGTTSCDINGFCTQSTAPNSGVETAGGITALVGAGLTAGGIVLMATNARTKTSQSYGGPPAAPQERPETSWLRLPTWHDASQGATAPKMAGVPLLSGKF